MAPHSSTLAWRIPWMEEPGGPQSMGVAKRSTMLVYDPFTTHSSQQAVSTRPARGPPAPRGKLRAGHLL